MAADRTQMELALRNILRDHRSILRRRAANDLNGPYREVCERGLLDEEAKLYMQAVEMSLKNEVLYHDVCRELDMVDGAVRCGERDHEQGENDMDKPTEKQKKKKKKKAKNRTTQGLKTVHELLQAAKSTAIRQREEWNQRKLASRDDEEEEMREGESIRKRAKRNTEKNAASPETSSITTRLRRRPPKPVPEVIETDDSD